MVEIALTTSRKSRLLELAEEGQTSAEVVLEQAARAGEMEDIEDRVAKLERTAGLARKSRKRSADLTWLSVTSLPCPTTTRGQIAAPPLDSTETDEDVIDLPAVVTDLPAGFVIEYSGPCDDVGDAILLRGHRGKTERVPR